MYSRSFLTALAVSLRKHGVSESETDYYIKKFVDTHDPEAHSSSMTYDEIDELAYKLTQENSNKSDKEFVQEFDFPDFSSEEVYVDAENIGFDSSQNPVLNYNADNIKRVDVTKVKHKSNTVKASPLFVLLFVLTLPLTVPLFCALCILLGAIYILVSLVVTASVLLLVGVVAAGTALSLVGIIYGITRISKGLPVALFEMGIGVALAGLTMLLSVLIYNLCVRLSPKLYKKVNSLSKITFGNIGILYNIFKKECAR